jgi:hypothetical protein
MNRFQARATFVPTSIGSTIGSAVGKCTEPGSSLAQTSLDRHTGPNGQSTGVTKEYQLEIVQHDKTGGKEQEFHTLPLVVVGIVEVEVLDGSVIDVVVVEIGGWLEVVGVGAPSSPKNLTISVRSVIMEWPIPWPKKPCSCVPSP